MYLVYLLREKATNVVIYVGSTSRPACRIKEHILSLAGKKSKHQKIHSYMRERGLMFFKDVTVEWVDCANDRSEMYALEEKYFGLYKDTLLNDRPAENRFGGYNPKRRFVTCLDDGKTFDTISECAKHYGIKRTTLSNVLHGYKPNKLNMRFLFNGKEV